MSDNLDHFEVLRKIKSKPNSSQRELANELGFSLGKLNYCLKALKEKGLIKIKNFHKNPNKIGYAYILTPKGISEKTKLTLNFMKRKMKEYDELKAEIANLKQTVKRLENEIGQLYEENVTFADLVKDIKTIKQELMKYTDGKIYFENSW